MKDIKTFPEVFQNTNCHIDFTLLVFVVLFILLPSHSIRSIQQTQAIENIKLPITTFQDFPNLVFEEIYLTN